MSNPNANKYVLTGQGISIDYTLGGNPSFVALSLDDNGVLKSFTPAEITTAQTALGTLVSVPVRQTIDTGGTVFGFFLPVVQVAVGGTVAVTSIGIFATFSGPDSFPHEPTTWQCVHLSGKAESVILPHVRGEIG